MTTPRRVRARALSDDITDRHVPDAVHLPQRPAPRRAALDWMGGHATRGDLDPEMPEPRRAARPAWLAVTA